MNVIIAALVIVIMLVLLGCLKAASDTDDQMERLKETRDDA